MTNYARDTNGKETNLGLGSSKSRIAAKYNYIIVVVIIVVLTDDRQTFVTVVSYVVVGLDSREGVILLLQPR